MSECICAAKYYLVTKGIAVSGGVALAEFKARLKDGQHLVVTFSDDVMSPRQEAYNYFHKLRDRYAEHNGYDKGWAKVELKYLCGYYLPYGGGFKPPKWAGKFVEMPEGYPHPIVFLKSVTAYTRKQLTELTERTKRACVDTQTDIQDLLESKTFG